MRDEGATEGECFVMWDIRLIERSGMFHVHHDGTKDEARARALRMARNHWPTEDGYTLKGTGKTSDCISAFRKGKHVGDIAVEPLDEIGSE